MLFGLISVFSVYIGFQLRDSTQPERSSIANSKTTKKYNTGKLDEIIRFIDSKHVDEVDREKLISKAIEAMLELDPNCDEVKSQDLQEVEEMEGVGVSKT